MVGTDPYNKLIHAYTQITPAMLNCGTLRDSYQKSMAHRKDKVEHTAAGSAFGGKQLLRSKTTRSSGTSSGTSGTAKPEVNQHWKLLCSSSLDFVVCGPALLLKENTQTRQKIELEIGED